MTLPAFQWPAAATPAAWSVAGWWLPSLADAFEAASTLFNVVDDSGVVAASLQFDDAARKLFVLLGAGEAVSDALTFAAGEDVFIAVRFDTVDGLALTVSTDAGGVQHFTDPSTDPGTDGVFAQLALGGVNGVLDELAVFAGRLTDDQTAALAGDTAQLVSLPVTPRCVWYAPFDPDLAPTPGALASGRRVETAADDNGFLRVVASLADVSADAGFGIASSADVTGIDLMAGLATAGAEDTAADMHDQFATANEQATRVR